MQTFADGDNVFGAQYTSVMSLWLQGTAVLAGCAVTGDTDELKATIGAGVVAVGGTAATVTGGTFTVPAASAFNRYDLIYVDASATAYLAVGNEVQKVRALPANTCPIAILQIDAAQTTLPATKIFDCRALPTSLICQNLTVAGAILGTLTGAVISTYASSQPSSATTLYTFSGTLTTTETSYTKVAEIEVPSAFVVGSRFRIVMTVKGSASGAGYARVYKDGEAYGDAHTTSDTTGIEFTDDLTFEAGELIQIYCKGTGGGVGGCTAATVRGTVCGGVDLGITAPTWS